MGQNWLSQLVFRQRQPLHQDSQSRRVAQMACDQGTASRSPATELWHCHSVGGVLKVTLQSLAILSLLTILIPYLYDVSADERQQIKRQRPGRERHTDNRRESQQAELKWGNLKGTVLEGPDNNYQSKWKPCIHDWIHNLQSPLQNENAKPLFRNY